MGQFFSLKFVCRKLFVAAKFHIRVFRLGATGNCKLTFGLSCWSHTSQSITSTLEGPADYHCSRHVSMSVWCPRQQPLHDNGPSIC